MRVLSLEKKILLAFVAGGLLLLGARWFAVESGRAYLAADAKADRLRDAERALLAVELSLRGVESGQRGYLLTGREDYLDPYARALDDVGGQIAEARELLAEQPEAMQLSWKMDSLLRFKLAGPLRSGSGLPQPPRARFSRAAHRKRHPRRGRAPPPPSPAAR